MTRLEAALVDLVSVMEALRIPYALIGGLAVSLWGEVRATLDVDLVVWVTPDETNRTVDALSERFRPVPKDPRDFVRATRVLPLTTGSGVRADIVFGAFLVEKELIERAVPREVAGIVVRLASIEDLVLMKLVSERQRDAEDARRLLRRHGGTLDRGYLEPKVAELAESLARPEILRLLSEALGE